MASGPTLEIADIYRWIAERHEPRFILPARFRDVSFESFEIDRDHPEHGELRALVAGFARERRKRGGLFRRRPAAEAGRGLFLVGPPGVGKTHLLASAYRAGPEPKLYASFDELVAAAGPLGMEGLVGALAGRELVCIDEVVLEDPGNIMMLVTLLQHMLARGVRIIATANMPPEEAGGKDGWMQSFHRELGAISSSFDIHRVTGRDRRAAQASNGRVVAPTGGPELRVTWDELAQLLERTHPMHDAGWLERIAAIRIEGRIAIAPSKDQALRFVRFIDRVYDRAVALEADSSPDPDELVAPLVGDPRFVWHVARGRSRLGVLLAGTPPEPR